MFGFFDSQEKKMRQNAANWLELADKVWAVRRDVLVAAEAGALQDRTAELRRLVRGRADAGKLKLAIEALEGALRRAGGAVYPKTSLTENIEFFLVAAIVILGIRTYFVQPFKIPTNSMWPSYYGMTGVNLPVNAPAPGPLVRAARLLFMGAARHDLIAPRSGSVSALFYTKTVMAFTKKSGLFWGAFPMIHPFSRDYREYSLYVDGEPVTIQLPYDFSGFDQLVIDNYLGGTEAFGAQWDRMQSSRELIGKRVAYDATTSPNAFADAAIIPLGRTVQAGDSLIRFDLLTGDQLFVDRFSYHFFRPKVGQGFVFRTGNIPAIRKDDYFIKRLVGTPGDVITVKPPILYRNGQPITGARAFDLNAQRVGDYHGYTSPERDESGNPMFLPPGGSVTVPPDGFFAMGDNSGNSADGRYWGFVPASDVIGRPLFIYYPFTRRWGPAR